MKDYIIASGNEKEFVKMAEQLGYAELVFVGDANLPKSRMKVTSSKRIIKSNTQKDRGIIESKKADIIFEFEQERRKDSTHFRHAGLNQVLLKLMKQKKVAYGLSFAQLLHVSQEERAKIIGRMLQNIRLCRKYKVPVVVASFARKPSEMRDHKDLLAFARTLGLNDYKA
jgi:hypothetical protein